MPRRQGDFKFNDEIYVKLAKHDQRNEEQESRRSDEDMSNEAKEYRQLFASKNYD